MSKLNRLYNAEKILCYQMHQKWGDNLLKVCPSIQWSLADEVHHRLLLKCSVIHLLNIISPWDDHLLWGLPSLLLSLLWPTLPS